MPRSTRSTATVVPRNASVLDVLVDQYKAASRVVKEAEAIFEPIKHALLKETTRKADAEGYVKGDGYILKVRTDSMEILDPQLLLQYGVSPRIIKKATRRIDKKPWVQVTVPKGKLKDGAAADDSD